MEWDERKRLSNLAKHGLDFRAFERFDWETAEYLDPNFVDGEIRDRVVGILDNRLVFVVFVDRGVTKRVISLRPATKLERVYWREQKAH